MTTDAIIAKFPQLRGTGTPLLVAVVAAALGAYLIPKHRLVAAAAGFLAVPFAFDQVVQVVNAKGPV